MQREKFSSRLGFILISAGCAIGLGNVWRFPYIVGKYGGAAFVLIYLAFLLILGLPIMVMEFSVGRASKVSAALSFDRLEPKGTKWHWYKYGAMAGNYLLMMFYTTIAGWMVQYFIKMMTGEFEGKDTAAVAGVFSDMLAKPGTMTFFMIIVVVGCFAICGMGLQNGVEKITKVMMLLLLALMVILAARSVTLDGASEGLRFYLAPDFHKVVEYGLFDTIFAAMGQAFFTLSLGIGAIAIFGSYIDKSRSLTGEAVLEEIRKKGNLPVIVLTAKDSLDEKVKVLTSGADDYITKPFEIREVLARIQVQLRHTEEKEIKESNLSFREMVLNKATFQVSIGGKILPKITRQEFAILELLLRNPKQVFSKEDIFEYAWDEPYMGETKTLDVHISNIRKKIKTVTSEEYIETVWGIGYRLHL